MQQLLHANKRSWGRGSKGVSGPSRGGPNARYLFTGIVYCDVCGSRFIGCPPSGSHRSPHYLCGRKNSGVGCKSSSVSETRLRESVIQPIEALLSRLQTEDIRVAVREELLRQQEDLRGETELERLGLSTQMSRLDSRLSKLEDTYLDGDIEASRYRLKRDELMVQLKSIKGQLEAKPPRAQPDIEQLFGIAENITLGDLDTVSWREIVLSMVERIEINGKPASVSATWKAEFAALMNQYD